jgi:hypothetical protein
MPIDYKKYPKNWLSEIRPRIMKRANNTCEFEGCDFKHGEYVWAVKHKGRTVGWYRDFEEANKQPRTIESRKNKKTGRTELVPNPRRVKVVLAIAHLDHDETNHNVKDERLRAACQLCHLRYDAKEKYKRVNKK